MYVNIKIICICRQEQAWLHHPWNINHLCSGYQDYGELSFVAHAIWNKTCHFKDKETDVAGGMGGGGAESKGKDISCLLSRKRLCFWGLLVPRSLMPHFPSTQASQVLFRQPPVSPAVSPGSCLLSWVSCLPFVLLVQSKKMLNDWGSRTGISFVSSEEMGPGVQSIVGNNGNLVNSFNKCLLGTYHADRHHLSGKQPWIQRE